MTADVRNVLAVPASRLRAFTSSPALTAAYLGNVRRAPRFAGSPRLRRRRPAACPPVPVPVPVPVGCTDRACKVHSQPAPLGRSGPPPGGREYHSVARLPLLRAQAALLPRRPQRLLRALAGPQHARTPTHTHTHSHAHTQSHTHAPTRAHAHAPTRTGPCT